MKKESNSFIKLISVIIVLLLVVIIALLSMPRMEEAREKAFRVEATRVVDSAKVALKHYNNKEYSVKGNSLSCKKGNELCISVSELKSNGYYKASKDDYVGKVVIDLANADNPLFYLYLKKSADMRIVGGFREDYINMGTLAIESWEEEYEKCNCE